MCTCVCAAGRPASAAHTRLTLYRGDSDAPSARDPYRGSRRTAWPDPARPSRAAYPDPPVAAIAVEWASRLLGKPLWRRLLRASWWAAVAYAALGVPLLVIWLLGAQLSIERGYGWAMRMTWTLGCFAYLLGPRRWAAARARLSSSASRALRRATAT